MSGNPGAVHAPDGGWLIIAVAAGLTTWAITHDLALAIAVTSLIVDALRPHD